jgi:hypothetical protein
VSKLGKRWKENEEAKKPGIRVFVATPAYDGKVHTDFCVSLAESCMYSAAMGIHVTAGVMGNGAFIDLARCSFVKMFLEGDYTHLFFIDSDLKFEARGFIGLILADLPIVAGVYRRRQEPPDYPVKYVEDERIGLEVVEGFVQCTRVPTGFLCIRRDVIERMAAKAQKINLPEMSDVPRLFYTYVNDEGRFVGEDFAFCDDYCKEFGTTIPVYADLDFNHAGYQGNWWEHLKKLGDAFEQKEAANG